MSAKEMAMVTDAGRKRGHSQVASMAMGRPGSKNPMPACERKNAYRTTYSSIDVVVKRCRYCGLSRTTEILCAGRPLTVYPLLLEKHPEFSPVYLLLKFSSQKSEIKASPLRG